MAVTVVIANSANQQEVWTETSPNDPSTFTVNAASSMTVTLTDVPSYTIAVSNIGTATITQGGVQATVGISSTGLRLTPTNCGSVFIYEP